MNNFININGGFPPIQIINNNNNKNNKKDSTKQFVKDRSFTSTSVNIINIISSKKADFIKQKEQNLDIVETL